MFSIITFAFSFLRSDCLKKCQEFTSLGSACEQLHILESEINKVANDAKAVFTDVTKYFIVDVELNAQLSGKSNTTKTVERIQQEVNDDISRKAHAFEVFIAILKKFLSLSIALLFLESFWYLRNYLAKDDYDNIYITNQFKVFDRDCELNGLSHVLPLKKKEKDIYVDPSSFKLNATELGYCRLGLAQILLHFILCVLLLMFDFSFYYILSLFRKYGDVDIHVEGEGHLEVTVNGKGPVALFYGVMMQGINLNRNFTASLETGRCLPNPKVPSVSIIPVLIFLYIITLCFVLLRGYGMRLRRKIAAFFYPEQETARLHYLHKKIRHKRIGLLKLIRQLIISTHKEAIVKDKLRLSTWLAFKIPFLGRFLTSKEHLVCTSCEHSEKGFQIKLTKCEGSKNGMACDAVYCQECWAAINHSCPLCTSHDEVVLRE